MNMKVFVKRTALAAMLVVLAPACVFASGASDDVAEKKMCVVIHEVNNATTAFDLAEKPVVSFDDTDVKLECGTVTVLYSLEKYLKMTIEEVSVETGMESLFDESFKITDSEITAQGCNGLSLYSVDGKCLATGRADANGVVTLSTSTLRSGIYVVVFGNKSFKIYKK